MEWLSTGRCSQPFSFQAGRHIDMSLAAAIFREHGRFLVPVGNGARRQMMNQLRRPITLREYQDRQQPPFNNALGEQLAKWLVDRHYEKDQR